MKQSHISDTFALSPMQKGMLFHYLKEPHSGVDVEQLVLHLSEEVDICRLQAAWKWLVGRHDILRVQFNWEGVSGPHQEVLTEIRTPFVFEDLRTVTDSGQSERLRIFLETDRLLGFELDRAPLLRFTLFQWREASFSLVWTFHHALLDGRSFPTLLREVFEAYDELAKSSITVRPTPRPYRYYIEWLAAQDFGLAESFWREYLEGFFVPTPLVVDRKTSDEDGYQQGEAWQHLDFASTNQVKEFAKKHDLTVNSLVMGAWAMLLNRYSGEEDVVFGATRACRKSSIPGADEIVGIFINTVPVRLKFRRDQSAISIFNNVRQTWMQMRSYEHTPLAQVTAVSQVPPAHPLFETLVVFENYRLDTAMRSLGGSWATRNVELHELTNFPITLAAYGGEELSFKIEFDRRRLDLTMIRRLLEHLSRLLKEAVANPAAQVRDLLLLNKTEREELIEKFNLPAAAPKSRCLPVDGAATLHSLFEAQVMKRPNAVALTCEGESLTYSELNAKSNRLARHLLQFGIQPDTLVGLCLDRSNHLVIAILAILKAGGAYLPIDLAYPAERLAFILEDARAPVLLTESKLAGSLPSTPAGVLCIDQVLAEPALAGEETNLSPSSGPDHLAYVIYTSGTTGKPKGSLITHRNVARLFPATESWYQFDDRDVWTLFHSCAFDFSVWEIWGALLYGGRIVVVPFLVSRSPEAFYQLLAKEKVTVLNQTPSAFRQLIQAEEMVGQRELALRYVVFGGEALEMQSLRPWFERHGDQRPRLINMYGITETTVHVTYRPLSQEDLNAGSVIGVPLPDLQVYILDARREPVPIGVPGEMYVGGAGLARGYLRRPELTEERFVPDHLTGHPESRLYRTGDLARFLPGRDIEYLGRIDNQVKIRGFRIELGEIESVLCQHRAVREAVVIAREDVPGTKRLVAYLVHSQSAPGLDSLRTHLKKTLPDYMVPAAFVFLDRLPLTNNGKVDQKVLPAPEEQRPELAGGYVAPRTLAEEKLAAIWSKVLRVERVGVNDNFFELGGDSILSIQIISLARRDGLRLTPTLLFANQTIAELAAAAGVADERQPGVEAAVGDVPLTPIQHWFFEQNLEELQHYNQAFLFEVKESLERSVLEKALEQLSRNHDSLRLRYAREALDWRQFYAVSEETVLWWMSLAGLERDEQLQQLEKTVISAQAGLQIESGPLWRAVYFDMGSRLRDRLLLVVHHLAIDGVAWRALLEDLEAACQQLTSGQEVRLPARTAPYISWAKRVHEFAQSESLQSELPYWKAITDPNRTGGAARVSSHVRTPSFNTEASASTWKVSLTAEETQTLLQQIPAAYNTQINDILLTALARAWSVWSGSRVLFTNLEGHGRENLFGDLDLSRTVGWFTSIFPVRLELSEVTAVWQPGETLKYVKEQLRQIPQRGIGYGILRYLSQDSDLRSRPEPLIVFNYLGQFDQVVAGSEIFRFASEFTGPWHSLKQRRRYELEVNSMVMDSRLEVSWTYSQNLHSADAIRALAGEFLDALRTVIVHCQSVQAGGRTPSDFPLARLDQPAIDRLVGARRDIEDVYPLSPIQTLFLSASPGSTHSAFDHWQSTLRGPLNVPAFQRAWSETLSRHSVLRSTIHSEGLSEPIQMVHRGVKPQWTVEDWSGSPSGQHAQRWSDFLAFDRAQPLTLTEAPVMRFALVRLADQTWRFLWSIPALLLDGWSWPIVFRDASQLYEAHSEGTPPKLEPIRPYRDYIEWLRRQVSGDAERFWREMLSGFREPTVLPSEISRWDGRGDRYAQTSIELPEVTSNELQGVARRLQVTLNTLVQGVWAVLLRRQSGTTDVVFGAAFAGRPTDLPSVESIAGPFVNNIPVRVVDDGSVTVSDFLRRLHARLLELNPYQFTPLIEIQRCSQVPLRHRLFDSLVVFQNYLVDESARGFGGAIEIADFAGPIHTNFPVLLLAEPGAALHLTLICDQQKVARSTVERWARDLSLLLELLPRSLDLRINNLEALLSAPAAVDGQAERIRRQSQNYLPPQTEMERTIAGVWGKMFDQERVGVEENFFDLGGHSLLLVRMHEVLRATLKTEFPVVTLFEHPTVRSLAGHLTQPAAKHDNGQQFRDAAQRQKQAMAKLKEKLKK
jgi:amino acid adenylation domain-containing protein/non-ribosomal peptide synthase protein (TIGR01720 family)